MLRIGYFVPEFPIFTHVFFWREIEVLDKMGVDISLISTKKPDTLLSGNHSWVQELTNKTKYLLPLKPTYSFFIEAIKTPMNRWYKVAKIIKNADDENWKGKIYLIAAAFVAIKLTQIIRKGKIEHIHSHFSYRGADIVLFASILADIPYSLSYHSSFCGIGNQKQKWRNAKFAICVTRYCENELIKAIGVEFLPKKRFIAAMGVDSRAFKRIVEYKPFKPNSTLRLFSAGRINKGKGHDIVIKAIVKLLKQGVNVQLRIAGLELGSDVYTQTLKRLINKHNLSDKVELLGAISTEMIKKELGACHIFVLASFNETFGVVYAESMAMEVPTIGTRAGGVPELIEDGVSGLLTEPGSVDDLVDKLSIIINEPEQSVIMGKAGRRRVQEYFSCEHSAQVLISGIKEL